MRVVTMEAGPVSKLPDGCWAFPASSYQKPLKPGQEHWTPECEQLSKHLIVARCVFLVCVLIVFIVGLSTS